MIWIIIWGALIAIDAIITVLYIIYLNKQLKANKEDMKVIIRYAEELEDQNNLLREILNNK